MKIFLGALAGLVLVWIAIMLADTRQDGRRQPIPVTNKEHPLKELWSGYRFQPLEIRAAELTQATPPGGEWLRIAELLWGAVEGPKELSCAKCHGSAASSMRAAGNRYPVFDSRVGGMVSIEARINRCRTEFLQAPPWASNGDELAAMTFYVRSQSRGMPIAVRRTGPAQPRFVAGRQIWETRFGDFGMSCSDCHDNNWSRQFGSRAVNQGHVNALPAFSLESQRPVTVQQQIARCMRRIHAVPFEAGSSELADLELYAAWRGNGMRVEVPSARP